MKLIIFLQKLLQDKSHTGLNPVNKEAFFQCDKETVSFVSYGALKLNTTYKQEFDLTNTSGKELGIEFYTTGFKEPHEIVFSPNYCIIFIAFFWQSHSQSLCEWNEEDWSLCDVCVHSKTRTVKGEDLLCHQKRKKFLRYVGYRSKVRDVIIHFLRRP